MFKFLPLGGVGFIGGNVSYFEFCGLPVLIDTGILFPKEESLGIDHLYPDLSILTAPEFQTPKFLMLTHAHEDHVGGLNHLLGYYPNIPIVCSDYSKLFIQKKFPKVKNDLISPERFKTLILEMGLKVKFNFFNLRHSIPGVYGFHCFDENKKLSILFCTDFRFDKNEDNKHYLSDKLLREFSISSAKRLAFIDSTNISSGNNFGVLEKDISLNIESEIQKGDGDTFITFFPSNIERLATIIRACNNLKRPCCLHGFSVEFSYSLGLEAGLLSPILDSSYKKGKSVLLLSGSQGDLRGAFRRVFTLNDKKLKPTKGDRLLFSSKVIPGNEKSVGEIFNKAASLGVEFSRGDDIKIHSSGHAYKDEILSILKNFKCDEVVPIHLETSFFQSFFKKIQPTLPSLIIHQLENYKSISSKNLIDFEITEYDPLDLKIFLQGGSVVDKSVLNNRRRLGINGALFISLTKEDAKTIKINSYGLPDFQINQLKSEVAKVLNQEWRNPELEEVLRIRIRHYLNNLLGFKPIVFVHLL